jgi:hypothetical protein
MNSRELLHRLLYVVLLDLRMESATGMIQHQKLFHLADLFHTIPLQLERAAQGAISYDDILEWLKSRAREKQMEGWLHVAVVNATTNENSSKE